jgi:hypothetical protein
VYACECVHMCACKEHTQAWGTTPYSW